MVSKKMETSARNIFFALFCVLLSLCFCSCSFNSEQSVDSFDRYSDSQKDFRQHVVAKRPTVLLNGLMYALGNAMGPSDDGFLHRKSQMELERRGYPKHYWKCYFNAVSCFRRKRQISQYDSLL